jgi:hypothetical protein
LAILAILMATLPSVCAPNSSMRNQLPRRPAKPLGPQTTCRCTQSTRATWPKWARPERASGSGCKT